MKTTAPVILGVAAAIAFAGPAAAKTSLAKGSQLCKAEAGKLTPALKSFRIDADETRINETGIWFTLNARKADDTQTRYACVVDRASQAVQFAEKQ